MKRIQKIWLLMLSSVLMLGALLTLIVSVDWNTRVCTFNGIDYEYGDVVIGYLENADCTCGQSGEVICELRDVTKSFLESSDFTTKNLEFNAEILNSLSNSEISIADEVVFRSVSQSEDGLRILIERVDLCTANGEITDQVGFYSLSENTLVLTTIETGDPATYTEPCVVQNAFLLTKLTGSLDDSFKVYYRDENDDVYLGDMCVYEGKLHNDGDTYLSKDNCELCQCIAGENSCVNSCED